MASLRNAVRSVKDYFMDTSKNYRNMHKLPKMKKKKSTGGQMNQSRRSSYRG